MQQAVSHTLLQCHLKGWHFFMRVGSMPGLERAVLRFVVVNA